MEENSLNNLNRVLGFNSTENAIYDGVYQGIESMGYELVAVKFLSGQRILRVYIGNLDNQKKSNDGIGLEDCTKVTHWLNDYMDVNELSDIIPGAFNLEVSSPGLSMPLTKPKHFIAHVGREIELKTSRPFEALVEKFPTRKKFRGEILETSATEAEEYFNFSFENNTIKVPVNDVESATLIPRF